MLFNSYIFVFVFLPLCLVGYFLLNRLGQKKLSQLWLLGMSLWFYGFFNVGYLLIIVASIILNYGFYMLSQRLWGEKIRKTAKLIAVVCNLGILFYYKYFDFFISNINAIFKTEFTLLHLVLPLGISFFTFQQVSLVIDAFNGEVPEYDFLSYACFVTFFPQLIAGPIVTHEELVPQLMSDDNKRFNWDNFSKGLYIFALGLGKKVLLADVLGGAANYGFAAVSDYRWETMNTTAVLIVLLSYTLQMYFDFSGYSDMAVGIGKMFNIDLPQNFDSPYKTLTIPDYWSHWHMTLMRFLRKYVYFPLGGNRKGTVRTCLNIMAVYLISGLWHGAGWTFILWGAMHGVFSVAARLGRNIIKKLPDRMNRMITFLLVMTAFAMFRADKPGDALFMWAKLIKPDFGPVCTEILEGFAKSEFMFFANRLPLSFDVRYMVMAVFLAVCCYIVFVPENSYVRMRRFVPDAKNSVVTVVLLAWSIFSFAGVSTFLYFNF